MASWIDQLRPASFRGARFHVDTAARAGGRRVAMHEFPKKDEPYAEDMGRRARRFTITAYVIGPFYIALRDSLIAALEREGPGTLIHPTMLAGQYVCIDYNCSEDKNRGGLAAFDMTFMEAGSAPNMTPATDTAGNVAAAAERVTAQAAKTGDKTTAIEWSAVPGA